MSEELEPTLEQKLESEIELYNQVLALEQQAGQERLQRLGRINMLQELIGTKDEGTEAEVLTGEVSEPN